MVKNLCKALIVLYTTVITGSVTGQERLSDLPQIIPPSPHAASLGKFGDIPVSSYTGIPDISIPVYTAHAGAFSLPISLKYHSQGLKVEEIAGYAGLHWALSAGGVITRSVHTGADERGGMGYWSQGNRTNESLATGETEMEDFCKGVYDLDPDIFYFNFNGRSGKFMMDATTEHKAHIIPYQSLAITHDATLSQFQILDENGIKYIFAAKETTTDDNYPEAGIKYFTSAWYLSKIETPAGDINFLYTSELTHHQQISEFQRIRATPDPMYCNFQAYQQFTASYEIYSLILTEINTPTEKINFSISGNRRDMPACNKLDGITVKDFNGSVKKKFELSYSYFGDLNSISAEAVRLKLDAIREVSLNNEYKNYAFEYYDPQDVPALSSKDRDYWGFYNGKTNSTLLPYVDPLIHGAMAANQATVYGNRDADFQKGRVGTLKKITYPTGGSTELIYEGHDYGYIGGKGQIEEYTKVTNVAIAQAKISGSINIPSATKAFSINAYQDVALHYQGSYVGAPPVENGPTVFLKKVNDDGSRTILYQRYMLNTTDVEYKQLQAGNYELVAIVDGSSQAATISMDYYNNSLPMIRTKPAGGIRIKQVINYDPVSNMRNIRSYQYVTKNDATRSSGKLVSTIDLISYQSTPGGCGRLIRSSYSNSYLGFTQGSHIGYSMVTETEESNIAANGKKEYYYTSASDLPNTNYLNYEYGYTTEPPYLVRLGTNPKYLTDYDFGRGLLTNEIFYDASGAKIKESIHEYNTGEAVPPTSPNYFEFISRMGYIVPAYTRTNTEGHEMTIRSLRLIQVKSIVPWIYKKSTSETLYSQSGSGNSSTTTNYFYDNPAHAQLTRTEVNNSKGQLVKTVNKYAADKNQIAGIDVNASTALDNMVLKNMIGPVIQQELFKNGNLLSLNRTDYKVWDGAAKIIAPEKIWQQTLNNSIENKLVFHAYDPNENVLEVAKKDNVRQSYIWDYRNSRPVAEVINASFSNIAYTSFESDGSGNWNIASADRMPGGITGNNCYQPISGSISKPDLAATTTYIVSYWTTNNSPFSIAGTQGAVVKGKQIGNWTYFEHKVSGVTQVSIPQTGGLIDELRLYPAGAQMATYTYDPLIGITASCAANNTISYYEYDAFQRLKLIRDQDGNIIKTLEYHYKAQ